MNRVALVVLGWLVAACLLVLAFMVATSSPTLAAQLPTVEGIQAPNATCVANTGDPTFFELRLSRLYAEATGSVTGYVKGIEETLPIAKVLEDERRGDFAPTDVQWVWVCTT